MTPLSLVFAGVGGQGVTSAARLLAAAAFHGGLQAVLFETRGLARRGGAVTAQVRITSGPVVSPQASPDAVGFVLGLEPLEAVRAARAYRRAAVLAIGRPVLPCGSFHDDYPPPATLRRELEAREPPFVWLETPDLERPPSTLAIGALATLGAVPIAWSRIVEATYQQFGDLGLSDLELGRVAITEQGLSGSWRPGGVAGLGASS